MDNNDASANASRDNQSKAGSIPAPTTNKGDHNQSNDGSISALTTNEDDPNNGKSCGCCGCCDPFAWSLPEETPPLVYEHEAKGRRLSLKDGTRIFVRDESPPDETLKRTVVMVHGVLASSFLYRKMFPPLVAKGYRAIAMDLPGLGLSDKPEKRDYSWPALAETLHEILEHPDLRAFADETHKVHLVLHDIGGPIAALYTLDHPERVHSITVLNTMLDIANFSPSFPLNFFHIPFMGDFVFDTITPWVFRQFMHLRGVADPKACDHDEAVAWVWLLKRKEGRDTVLKIMESFPWRRDRIAWTDKILEGLGKQDKIGMQIVWARGDVAIPPSQARYVRDNFNNIINVTADKNTIHALPGRHYFQLESADAIVDQIHEFLDGEPAFKRPPCLKEVLDITAEF